MPDFNEFHQNILPLAPRLQEAARSIGQRRSMALQNDNGDCWTYRSDGEHMHISRGSDSPDVVAELDAAAFDDLLSQRYSIVGLFYSNRLRVVHGDINQLIRWEPALQAMYYERPIWSKKDIDQLKELDLRRSFSLSDVENDPATVKQYLLTAGFLHIRNVFDADEVTAFRQACEQQKSCATPEDGRSWWAKDSAGAEICCRLTYLNRVSDLLREVPADPRLLALAALPDQQLVWAGDRMDGVSVVIKNPEVVEGMSDLPWHRDCGTGGHHLICPGLNIGIQLDAANAENGQLRFLAGSSRHANYPVNEQDPDLPIVAIDAQPGDVTVHFGHTMHVAPPPTAPDANRRVVYCGYNQQKLLDAIPEGSSYNDVLFTKGDGRVRTPQEENAMR